MNYEALACLSYGMYLISSVDDVTCKSNALLASLAMQVSSDPPTVCISISKNNLTHDLICRSKKFNITVLSMRADLEFIGPFGFQSGRDVDKLKNVSCLEFNGINTVVENCNAVMECELSGEIDLGASTVFFGRILSMKALSYDKSMTYDYYQTVIKGGVSQNSPARVAAYVTARNAR